VENSSAACVYMFSFTESKYYWLWDLLDVVKKPIISCILCNIAGGG
jgi:hypothetical protein